MADKNSTKAAKIKTTAPKTEEKSTIRKKFSGVVVSDAMDKTIVVKVDSVKIHPKYKKRFTMSKKYKVHDEKNQFKENDAVTFIECRPYSKDKKWRVIYS
jgi:small subunit ribosomal protein S17